MVFYDLITSGWRDYLAGRIPWTQVQPRPSLPTFVCPHTKTPYQAAPVRVEMVGSLRYAWVRCGCCDMLMHAVGDPDYDPKEPQLHAYPLQETQWSPS